MKLIVVSGLSGSGKSIALNTLEDLDYYCIDNLPIGMLANVREQLLGEWGKDHSHVAVGIDARNSLKELKAFPELHKSFADSDLTCEIFFLEAEENVLLKRYSETRRKHPLTDEEHSLFDAIQLERELLAPIAATADLVIDTSHTNIYELRDLVRNRVAHEDFETMSLLFESFGFKKGLPSDADFIFDVRCLPNPHWEASLRPLTGKDEQVVEYLKREPWVEEMKQEIITFLDKWIPRFEKENRTYMTVAIGCTGGQHRSVFLVEEVARFFVEQRDNVIVRHRELS
jgi:UPF0042 nucleotide-binding protein